MIRKGKQRLIGCIPLFLLLAMTGCQAGNKDTASEETVSSGDTGEAVSTTEQVTYEEKRIFTFPEGYQYADGNLVMDIQIHAPEEVYFYEATAVQQEIDYSKLARALIPEQEQGEIEEEPTDVGGHINVGDKYSSYWGNGFLHAIDYSVNIEGVFPEYDNPEYNLDRYAEEREFSFATKEQAQEAVTDFLDAYGIRIDDTWSVSTYYLDHSIMEEEYLYNVGQSEVKEPDGYVWSEKDDAYMFYLHKTYCGLEEHQSRRYMPADVEDCDAQIRMYYADGKIGQFMLTSSIYQYQSNGTAVDLLSFDEIVETLKRRYGNVESGDTFRITDATLYCDLEGRSTDVEREAFPAWAFRVEQTYANEGFTVQTEVYIDARTGKVIQQ